MKIAEQSAFYGIENKQDNLLPITPLLNINAFSSIFRHTTNSYKPLFFLALLNKLKTQTQNNIFTFDDLATEMTVLAWYPLNYFHLSFGKQDQVGKIIARLDVPSMRYNITNPSFQQELKILIQQQKNTIKLHELVKYVPYRLLSPFFTQKLKGMQDSKKDQAIMQLANDGFSENTSLYRFIEQDGKRAIQINLYWDNYLRTHFKIIYRWVLWEWSCYLQIRNPNTPAILNKIIPPTARQPLTPHAAVWKQAIKAGMSVNCIYTGEALTNQPFALDHFLPWSFVCHNQFWNLTPVTTRVNSKKSNLLPLKESINLLVEQQHELITLTSTLYSPRKWQNLIASHINDLHLDEKDMLSKTKLNQAYQDTLKPLLTLARQAGFETIAPLIKDTI